MRDARLFAWVTAVAIGCWQHPVLAVNDATRSAARNLVNEGANDFKAGRFELARNKFVQALAVAQVPTVAVWAARANEKLGKLVAAVDLYERALLMQPNDWWVGDAQRNAQQQARQALKGLKSRIPSIRILLNGSSAHEAQVTLDNAAIPIELLSEDLPLDPGPHRVTAVLNGNAIERQISLSEGVKQTVTLTWPASAASTPKPKEPSALPTKAGEQQAPTSLMHPPELYASQPRGSIERRTGLSSQQTAAWIATGLGATGVIFAAVSGTIVGLERSSLHADGCVDNTCPNSLAHRVHVYNTWRTISMVSIVAGGVALATGLTLVLYKPHMESRATLNLSVLPDTIKLTGSFRGL